MARADRERWDTRHRARREETHDRPHPFLAWVASQPVYAKLFPPSGRALDVAGGAGRNAVWLARRGLEVTLVDISPVGLERAERAARRAGVAMSLVASDLEEEPLPAGPWNLVVCTDYLQRSLFPRIAASLAPDGLFLFAQPTRANLARHPRPGPRFLLEEGELARRVPTELEILFCEEGWTEEGRHEARLLARRR
ncbi:MAG: class I SAM-dependent methyltransferase [Planctomycetota bacterium]|nr:MAG: class I SAM-dependent methyltransferase [Planctomycetota bacterium]